MKVVKQGSLPIGTCFAFKNHNNHGNIYKVKAAPRLAKLGTAQDFPRNDDANVYPLVSAECGSDRPSRAGDLYTRFSGREYYFVKEEEAAVPPPAPPIVPEGYEWTGEYRVPKDGEFYRHLSINVVLTPSTTSSVSVSQPRYILRKKGVLGQEMPKDKPAFPGVEGYANEEYFKPYDKLNKEEKADRLFKAYGGKSLTNHCSGSKLSSSHMDDAMSFVTDNPCTHYFDLAAGTLKALPTSEEDNMINIQKKTLVNGTDIEDMKATSILSLIVKAEKEIAELEAVQVDSKYVKKQIKDLQEGIDTAVKLLDAKK